MKILYFSTARIPSRYANSVHVMKMCSALSEKNNEVTLVSLFGEHITNPFEYYAVKETFEIIRLRNSELGILQRVLAMVKNKNYDLIYTRYTLAAYIYSFILKKNVIYEYHGVANRKMNFWFEKQIAKRNNVKHVFITEALMNHYQNILLRLQKQRCIVLPDGADLKSLDEHNNPKRNAYSCGYIGSFQKGKGVELVVRIAELIPKVQFHIVGGSSEDVKRIKNSTNAKNIIWYGHLNQESTMEILEYEIDIALLPNQKQVFVGEEETVDIGKWTSPMKLFEYMAYGKAIIASDISVLKEVIINGYNAIFANPEDPNAWADAIYELIKEPSLMDSIGKNARKDLEEKYTWAIRAEKALEGIATNCK